MKRFWILLPATYLVVFIGCTDGGMRTQPAQGESASAEPRDPAKRRSKAGLARLVAAGESGKIVANAIECHGGLGDWFDNETLKFRYDYVPTDPDGMRRDSTQTVELLSSRVYHDVHHPVAGAMAFDGEEAWSTFPPEKVAARFWALTPYYFVAMPFVLADPGVRLSVVQDDPKAVGLPPGPAVKVTYEAGIGDAPDDYYIVYFNGESGCITGLRYIVTYEPFFAGKEAKHSPEKLLVYSGARTVGGLVVPTHHTFYAMQDGARSEQAVTHATVTDIAFAVPFDEERLRRPEHGRIDRALADLEKNRAGTPQ